MVYITNGIVYHQPGNVWIDCSNRPEYIYIYSINIYIWCMYVYIYIYGVCIYIYNIIQGGAPVR